MSKTKKKILPNTKEMQYKNSILKKIFLPIIILSTTAATVVGLSFAIKFVNKKNKSIGNDTTKKTTYVTEIQNIY